MINPDLRRKIKVRRRPDLTIKDVRYGGQTYYVVKDPISLRYYRFREEELFLLNQFDGKNTLDDIRHEFVEHFRPQRISVQDLEKFTGQLLQSGIATTDTPMLGQRLYERYRKQKLQKIKQFALNILYIKLPVFDPERLLTRLLPHTRFLFTIPFFLLAASAGLAALMLMLVNWNTFIGKLPTYHEFFTWRNLLYLWGTLAIVKVLHEFGHGLACKRFGGEVHEMGFLFLVLTPCLYCNVSDAWMLPSKWHRAIIGAAGMYVELILSTMFVFVWWFTEPGLLHNLALSIVFICSVSTVVFNANPLMRFDGYYILSDLIEIPNLRERSNKYLGNLASRFFLGADAIVDPYMPKRGRAFFAAYAISAYVYRWMVTIAILWFLYTFLKPYKLGSVSAMLGTGAAISMAVLPVWQIIKFLRERWRSLNVSTPRLVVTLIGTGVAIAAILFIPFPMRIDAPMILQPKDATTVYVQLPGRLTDLNVKDGDAVTSGTILARQIDPELDKLHARARLDYEHFQHAQRVFLAAGQLGKAGESQLRAETAQQHVSSLAEDLRKLSIVAPVGAQGVVFSPPKPQDIGRLLKPGQVFCQIGDPQRLEAYIVVPHSDTSLLHPGQRVWLKLAGHVGGILEGTVERVSITELEHLPAALSNKSGGEVPTTTDEITHQEKPLFKSYSVVVFVDNPDRTLAPGIRGVARIDVGWRSLWWRTLRLLQQTFHFRM